MKPLIQSDDEKEIRDYLLKRGIDSFKNEAGFIPQNGCEDQTQQLVDRLPTDHILAVSYEDSSFIRELIFAGNWGTLKAMIDKDRV